MRRILFYLGTGTNERQYTEMTTKIATQYRERIFPVLQSKLYTGLPDLEFAPWAWVRNRMGYTSFSFWMAAPWSTTSQEDIALDAMITQHLECSIIPLVYWDDVTMEWDSHDCSYDINDCSTCTDEEWGWDTITTRAANDMLAEVLNPTN